MTFNKDDKIVIIAIVCVLSLFIRNVVAGRTEADYYPKAPQVQSPRAYQRAR